MNKKMSGIYAIANGLSSKNYIGSSVDVDRRWNRDHLPSLRRNKHFNRHLQHAWNKYGEDAFEFKIIEECEELTLAEREGFWIEATKSWDRQYGYNLSRIVEGRRVLSDETRLKMSEAQKKHPQEVYDKISNLYQNGVSKNYIAKQLGLDRATVYHHLEKFGLYECEHRGVGLKLNDEVQELILALRSEGFTWEDILREVGISRTQVYRTGVAGDGLYGGDSNRDTYRVMTPELIIEVQRLRNEGNTCTEIASKLGLSRTTMHYNGIRFAQHSVRKGRPKMKITGELRNRILDLNKNGMNPKSISGVTGVAESTVRLQLKRSNKYDTR